MSQNWNPGGGQPPGGGPPPGGGGYGGPPPGGGGYGGPPGGPPPGGGGYGAPPGGPPPGGYGAPPGGFGGPPPGGYGGPNPYGAQAPQFGMQPPYTAPVTGSLGLGFLAGFFGGCIGLILVYAIAKGPETKKGAGMGFAAQIVLGAVMRAVAR
jgi:hypothetical protein